MPARWYKRRWFHSHGPDGVQGRPVVAAAETGTRVPTGLPYRTAVLASRLSLATWN
ncbi:hypothetical protein HanRHA438_Chr12g0551001 [Helianthus annuus]|nr:hypothetical protein HanRHA438_Chr12g0551001 [Helianthus annuus]